MQISACPKCERPVTIPGDAQKSATMRCPMCEQEFALSDMVALEDLPPMLVVVGGIETPVDDSTDASGSSDSSDDNPLGFMTEGSVDAGDVVIGQDADAKSSDGVIDTGQTPVDTGASFAFGDDSDDQDSKASSSDGITASISSSSSVSPSGRPRRKQKSMAVEMLKVAGGGVVGLSLAILILWWGMSRDPFDLAPNLPEFMAVLAPEHLRNPDSEDDADDPGSSDESESTFKEVPESSSGLGDTFRSNQGGNSGKRGNKGKSPDETRTKTVPEDTPDVNPFPGQEELDLTGIDDGPDLEIDPLATPDLEPIEKLEPAGFRNAPEVTQIELGEHLKPAHQAFGNVGEALDTSNDRTEDERREIIRAVFDAFSSLGEPLCFIDPDGKGFEGRLDLIRKDANEMLQSARLSKFIGILGGKHLEAERESQGIIICGKVASIESEGRLFRADLELLHNGQIVPIYSVGNPTRQTGIDETVIVLGTIVEKPTEKLVGYEGEKKQVIWAGMMIKSLD